MTISIEMDLDKVYVRRTMLGKLDLISKIGGLQNALGTGCRALVLFINFRALHLYLASNLFGISH